MAAVMDHSSSPNTTTDAIPQHISSSNALGMERSESRASGTTYHSFHDVELFAPPSPPRPPVTYDAKALQQLEMLQYEQRQHNQHYEQQQQFKERRSSDGTRMQRQDSGYESITPHRTSTSNGRPTVTRRSSNGSTTEKTSKTQGLRNRPSLRRAKNSHPLYNGGRNSNQSLHLVRTSNSSQPTAFFHFPSPDPVQLAEPAPDRNLAPTPVPTPPPRTTHYWTSDRTRRLEYAAIDAATRGVKGWIMRHLVPDCFIPGDNRHVSFDDDSGSVRRYRLELEDDMTGHKVEKMEVAEEPVSRRKGWRFWRRRKNMTNNTPMVPVYC